MKPFLSSFTDLQDIDFFQQNSRLLLSQDPTLPKRRYNIRTTNFTKSKSLKYNSVLVGQQNEYLKSFNWLHDYF